MYLPSSSTCSSGMIILNLGVDKFWRNMWKITIETEIWIFETLTLLYFQKVCHIAKLFIRFNACDLVRAYSASLVKVKKLTRLSQKACLITSISEEVFSVSFDVNLQLRNFSDWFLISLIYLINTGIYSLVN